MFGVFNKSGYTNLETGAVAPKTATLFAAADSSKELPTKSIQKQADRSATVPLFLGDTSRAKNYGTCTLG